jgi:FkbM family methyltransferase
MVRWWEPETAILDVGCNLGQMSACVARAPQRLSSSDSATQVIGVEARSSIADLANKNFALNNINGNVIEGAAWSDPDIRLPLTDIDLSVVGSAGSLGVTSTTAPPSTADSAVSVLLDQISFDRRVSVLKLDIQGSEFRALEGATGLIRSHSPVIIF